MESAKQSSIWIEIPFWDNEKILLDIGNHVSLEIKVGHFILL